ncbi:MAG: Spy/CpxP family protein refolding chaperone [Bacteroidota bacterium]|nr:Spy/CpxP family protein refolding chaperone [Bacteroidota bacterium]
MKTKTLLTQVFIAVLFLSTIQVQGQGRNFDGQRQRNSNAEYRGQDCRIPDLSDEQEAQITELRNAHYAEVKNSKADLAILRAEKQRLIIADSPDANAINAKIDAMSEIQSEMQKNRVAHRLAVRNLLTPEQKVYFDMHRSSRNGRYGMNNKHQKDRGMHHMGGHGMRDGSYRY